LSARTDRWPLAAGLLAAASFLTFLASIPQIFVPDTALGWVDAWYYVGLMQSLPESIRQYGTSLYQAERLAWIVPGFVINQIAPPLIANYTLKGVFFFATVFFLFGAVRQTCGFRAALFVSALASLYSFLAHSLGTSYIDGATNTYFLIAIYAVNRAALGERFGALGAFVAGVACVAILFTQLAYVAVMPLFAAYALLMRMQAGRRLSRSDLVHAGCFVTGAAATWIVAFFLYRYWGVPGWPLQVQLGLISQLPSEFVRLARQREMLPLRAYWLILPATVVAWILPSVIQALAGRWAAALRLVPAYWLLLSVSALWITLNAVKAPWMLLPWYASVLIPATFLALGPVTAPFVEKLSAPAYWGLLGLLFCEAFASYRFTSARFADEAAMTAGACLILATLVRAASRFAEGRSAFAVLALLVLAVVSIDFATADYAVQLRNGYRNTEMSEVYHEPPLGPQWAVNRVATFRGAVEAAETLRPLLAGRSYYFWYSGNEPLGMFFRSVGSMFYAWSTRDLLDERFQHIDSHVIPRLLPQPHFPGRDVVILTRRADVRVEDVPLDRRWTRAFTTAGTQYFAHYFAVNMVRAAGFEPSPRRLELALRFPCAMEGASAALWYDRGVQTTRNSADKRVLQEFFNAKQDGPIPCLASYRALIERFAADEHGDPYVPAAPTCDGELAIADAYVAQIFDDPLRQATRSVIEIARIARQEGQTELCRVAVGEIRRAYFETIFGARDRSAAASRQRVAAIGVDFEPTPLRVQLASRFPCSVEVATAARWWDAGGGIRTSADREAIAALFAAARQNAIRCLAAYKPLTERLGAAEQRSPFVPSAATCDSELAIADAYVSKVFDAPIRQRTVPLLDAARLAKQSGRIDDCRQRTGEIRRAYFDAIYGRN
jgi:hypothetical protein